MAKSPRKSPRSDEPLVQRVYYRRGSAEILLALREGEKLRFTEICRQLPELTDQIVSSRLADLREIGMVSRAVAEGPPIVTSYSLTELGEQLALAASTIKAVAQSEQLPVQAA